jgi:hypothetical protein
MDSTRPTLRRPSWLSFSYFLFGCAIPFSCTLYHNTCKHSILIGSFTPSFYSLLLLGLAPKIDLLILYILLISSFISLTIWFLSNYYLHDPSLNHTLTKLPFFLNTPFLTRLSPNLLIHMRSSSYNLQACLSFILPTYLLKSMFIAEPYIGCPYPCPPMPMGFGWAWVGIGFVHLCIQLQIGVKLLGCRE